MLEQPTDTPVKKIIIVNSYKDQYLNVISQLEIGDGVLKEQIQQGISKENLSDCVHLLGAMSPGRVRAHMEQSEIL